VVKCSHHFPYGHFSCTRPSLSAIQVLSSEIQNVVAEVQGFAHSFTSETITATSDLCINKSDGKPVCLTGDQLAALLTGQGLQQASSPASAASSSTTIPPSITINGYHPAVIIALAIATPTWVRLSANA
jgi:hypothetical protein